MKKILLLTAFFLLIFSCEKESDDFPLFGKWDWISSFGGWGGSTSESSGDNILIEFTKDSIYRKYYNDSLVREDTFYIIKSESKNLIVYYNSDISESFKFRNDTLILREECIDCFISEYKKLE